MNKDRVKDFMAGVHHEQNQQKEPTVVTKLINPRYVGGTVEFKLDCTFGCTKKALALLIKELQDIHDQMGV